MTGHYQMQRGWMENPAFRHEPYTRAQAWCFLIEKAAWKDRIQAMGSESISVQRGEYAASIRYLAERWKWSKSKVDTFLNRLESEKMLKRTCSKTGTATGTPTGTALTVISICNYEKYQASADNGGTPTGTPTGTRPGQHRDKGEEVSKKGRKERGPYAFEGKVIKLTESDFTRWERVYKNISNLRAQLESRDAWLSGQPESAQKTWFRSTAAWLANKDADAVSARPTEGEEIDPNWKARQDRAEQALKERDGSNILPGPGSTRKPGTAA